jgi:Flp pilus assembly protein TadD/predicted hydrocarbon binding protein/TolB-like protein
MSSAGIGRLFIASLHQALSELIPARVPFYEPWLTTDGFRTSRVSLAGIRAAFSFLRREDGAYEPVMRRAGELAATWVWQDLSLVRRAWIRAMPAWMRRRAASRLARHVVTDAWRETKLSISWRRGSGRMSVRASLFCDVRDRAPGPLCHYYAAGLRQLLQHAEVESQVHVEGCQATGGTCCEIVARQGTASRSTGSSSILAGLVVAGVVSSLVPAWGQARAVPPYTAYRVLVMPFDNVSRDPRLSWLREGAALLLTDRLRAAGADTLTRDERLRVFERLQVPPRATLSRATVIRLGYLVGASDVVTGEIDRDGDAIVVRARRIRLQAGILEPGLVERASPSELMPAFSRLAAQMPPASGPVVAPGVNPVEFTPAPTAFEQYVKGLQAPEPATQLALLRAALSVSPSYDEARLALWHAHTAAGDHRAAAEAVAVVAVGSARHVEAEFLQSLSLLSLGQVAEAMTILRALQSHAASPVFLNNLGVALLRDPGLGGTSGRASWYFDQARILDGQDADYTFNLGYAYWLEGDPSGAVYWLRECVRLVPTDGVAHALLAGALQAAGQTGEAARELSLAQRLSSTFNGIGLKAGVAVPRGLERLEVVLDPRHGRGIDAALEGPGPQDQQALAAFYLDRGRRLADRELDRAAEEELTRALYFSPYDAEAHLLLAQICLRTGRLREAINAVKISLWSHESAAAHLVLAEAYLETRDLPAARSEAERARDLDANSLHARKLLERLSKQE